MRTIAVIVLIITFITVLTSCSSTEHLEDSSEQISKRARIEEYQIQDLAALDVLNKDLLHISIDSVIKALPLITREIIISHETEFFDKCFLGKIVSKILSADDVESMKHVLRLQLPINDLIFDKGLNVFTLSTLKSFAMFKLIYETGMVFKLNRESDIVSGYLVALSADKEAVVNFLEAERKSIKTIAMKYAICANREDYVENLLKKKGVDPNLRLLLDELILHKAINLDNKNMVTSLLKAGADPYLKDIRSNYNAILVAVSKGKIEALKALLDFGVSSNLNISGGTNILHLAIANDHLKMAEYLMSRRFDFIKKDGTNFFILCHLARKNTSYSLKYVFDLGANVYETIDDQKAIDIIKTKNLYNSRLTIKDPAVVLSILASKPNNLELFLQYGLNPNIRIFNGTSTLLHVACELKEIAMARLLIKYGADTNALDVKGRSPLSFVQDPESLKILKDSNEFL